MTACIAMVDLPLFCLLILVSLLVAKPGRGSGIPVRGRLFSAIIVSIAMLLILDAVCALLDSSSWRSLLIALNMAYFVCHPVPMLFFILYIDYIVFGRPERLGRTLGFLGVVWLFLSLFPLANLIYPWFFDFTSHNTYRRASWFPLLVIPLYLPTVLVVFQLLRHKKRLDRREFWPLILFPLPGLLGSFIQLSFVGTSLVWTGMTLSAIFLYIHIQNRQITEDYLTGACNRRYLDEYLSAKIRHISQNATFSGMMIDLDNFKKINDQYGHATGDAALISAVRVLRLALRNMDFVARFAGDEFVVILDSSDAVFLDEIVRRIQQEVDNFNTSGQQYYNLGFSIGTGIYDPRIDENGDKFLTRIDAAMYQEKKKKKMPGYENRR